MIYKNEIDPLPVPDSPNNDALEAIIEVYYQVEGYITSAGKWFWVKEKGKKQRGYQDIDILAIKRDETIIGSVTSNLDDKIGFNNKGNIDTKRRDSLVKYFERVEWYLKSVKDYSWLIEKPRVIKRDLIYLNAIKNKDKFNKLKLVLGENQIQPISGQELFIKVNDYLDKNSNLKVQNPMLRTFQVLKSKGLMK